MLRQHKGRQSLEGSLAVASIVQLSLPSVLMLISPVVMLTSTSNSRRKQRAPQVGSTTPKTIKHVAGTHCRLQALTVRLLRLEHYFTANADDHNAGCGVEPERGEAS